MPAATTTEFAAAFGVCCGDDAMRMAVGGAPPTLQDCTVVAGDKDGMCGGRRRRRFNMNDDDDDDGIRMATTTATATAGESHSNGRRQPQQRQISSNDTLIRSFLGVNVCIARCKVPGVLDKIKWLIGSAGIPGGRRLCLDGP